MAPRRSGRGSASAYKKGDYIEYQYKGSTVTGKLYKKSPDGNEAKPVWIVTPSDRRRKNEDIPEKALGKIINAQEAMSNRGPKLKKGSRITRDSSSPNLDTSNSDGDGSLEDEHGHKRGSKDNSKAGGSPTRKRKSNDSITESGGKSNKNRKTVAFSQKSNNSTAALKKEILRKSKKAKTTSTRIGTRSTRGSGDAVLLSDIHDRKKVFKTKKIKKDENVKVVKMLTGILYLYRGERPRAEFVRFK